ncbi:MAG: glutamine amidotransferase-related protein [Alphaproteobacteria bacterium]
MTKTALVIRHATSIDLHSLAPVLQNNDISVRYIDIFKEDISTYDPKEDDLVIVLGGAMGVPNQREYPFLQDEIAFLKARIADDLPTFGICLGAQLISAALGAKVYAGAQGFELGWAPLTLTQAGENTPVKHFSADQTQMFFSHGDTFDLPDGAVLLASSEMYPNQAYTYGKNVLATQFHPEVECGFINELLGMHVAKLTGESPVADIHQIRVDTDQYAEQLKHQTSTFLTEWLKTVLSNERLP